MPIQTSLFLPPNMFGANNSYAASLIGANASTSTLAIRCVAAASQSAASQSAFDCGPAVPTTTITVAPTTIALTTVSTAHQSVYTITETCTMAPALSTAVCNITVDSGLYAPFRVDKADYLANVVPKISIAKAGLTIHSLPVNVTNVAEKPTATSTSTAAAGGQSTTLSALLALCAVSAMLVM